MKNFLEKIQSYLALLGTKLKRKPKDMSAVNEPKTKPRTSGTKSKVDRFTIISWVVTILVVVALLGSTIYYKNSRPTTYASIAQPTSSATGGSSNTTQPQVSVPTIGESGSGVSGHQERWK